MKSVLIQVCCAHCAAYTVQHWRQQGYTPSGLWYNPNIHPFTEHQQRLEAVQSLAAETDLPLLVEGYDPVSYFRAVTGHEAERCRHCFRLRLSRTAAVARQQGFTAFTTTLLISPHQQHHWLHDIGQEVARESGLEFLYADLRKRYSDSRCLTKPRNLYRQQYCGCLYSEWERYADIKLI
ncbi:MAG: epoxyqueuosine reductase QueH [Chloroflexota bacterium]